MKMLLHLYANVEGASYYGLCFAANRGSDTAEQCERTIRRLIWDNLIRWDWGQVLRLTVNGWLYTARFVEERRHAKQTAAHTV